MAGSPTWGSTRRTGSKSASDEHTDFTHPDHEGARTRRTHEEDQGTTKRAKRDRLGTKYTKVTGGRAEEEDPMKAIAIASITLM
jgi:hypothetical protein